MLFILLKSANVSRYCVRGSKQNLTHRVHAIPGAVTHHVGHAVHAVPAHVVEASLIIAVAHLA
jgi:hypothetical protein